MIQGMSLLYVEAGAKERKGTGGREAGVWELERAK